MDAMQSDLTSNDAKVFELLNEASRQYDEYVSLAREASSSALNLDADSNQRSWSHPMGLVISQTR